MVILQETNHKTMDGTPLLIHLLVYFSLSHKFTALTWFTSLPEFILKYRVQHTSSQQHFTNVSFSDVCCQCWN